MKEERIPDEYCKYEGIEIKNVGDLKRALDKLPDDLDVAYGGDYMKLLVSNAGEGAPTDPFIVLDEIDD